MFDFERVCGVEAANSMEPWTPFSIIVVFMLAILMVGLLSFRELQMFGTADIKIIQGLKWNECNVYNSCLLLCKLYWQISLCVQKWAAETASSKPRSALNRFHLQRWKPGDSR